MEIGDQHVQRGLLATITLFLGAAWWWIRRRINIADRIEFKVNEIDKDYVTKEDLAAAIDGLRKEIGKVHTRVDDIYDLLARGKR